MNEIELAMSTPPVTCSPGAPVEQVARVMHEHDIGFVPVVECDGSLVGVVTDRDVVMRAVALGRPSTLEVSAIMTEEPVSISVGASVLDAVHQMALRRCRRLPVIGRTGMVVGVLSLDDVLADAGEGAELIAHLVATEGQRVLVLP